MNETTDRIYVNIDYNSTIGVIDRAAAVEAIIPVPGTREMRFAVDENLGRVYAPDNNNHKIYVIDANPASPTFNTILESIDTGWSPESIGINTDTHEIFTANYGDNTVSALTPDLSSPEFKLSTGVLTIAEVMVGGKTFAVQLAKRAGGFVFDLLSAAKTARACPPASYDIKTGVLDLPVVRVGKKTYHVQLTKRPGSDFVFDLTSVRQW